MLKRAISSALDEALPFYNQLVENRRDSCHPASPPVLGCRTNSVSSSSNNIKAFVLNEMTDIKNDINNNFFIVPPFFL
jgi:hypothetical protein